MNKKIKMVLYGEPGVGKSVFALGSPKPFFITTDGNYEWLEDFGAKDENHIQVSSWSEAKKIFAEDLKDYDTIVVDLTEDLFKWCEYEFCKKNKLEHISDIGFGKGYDITRNEFYIEISKLLAKDKNIILIMHGLTIIEKDRRGVEHTKYVPTNRIPDKVLDMIEGRVRYFLRCYLKAEEIDGKLVKKRYLSLIPKENEFGIARGLDENTVPSDINLDFKEFMEVLGITNSTPKVTNKNVSEPKKKEVTKEEVKEAKDFTKELEEIVTKKPTVKSELKSPVKNEVNVLEKLDLQEDKVEISVEPEVKKEPKVEVKEEPKVEVKENKPLTNEEKLAAIRAKLEAIRNRGKK